MFYNFNKIFLTGAFFFVFSILNAQFIPCDSIYTVPYSPFLRKIDSLKDFNGNVMLGQNSKILPLQRSTFSYNAQELLKHNGKVYVFLAQTGFIFQMSAPQGDSVVFRKIDNTYNINYNIDCINFIYKDQIYNYGGYGFWTKTSHVRKYNKVDQEWDIQPTNIEVYNSDYGWFSAKEGRLYVPFQKIEKPFLKGVEYKKGIFTYDSYYLDINTMDWHKTGRTSQDLVKLISLRNNYISFPHEEGRIFLINDEAYLFNYIHNKIYKSKKSDMNQFFIRNGQELNVFYHQGVFYKYNPGTQNFKTWKFNYSDFQLLDFPIWSTDFTNIYWTIGIGTVLFIFIGLLWLLRKNVKSKIEKAQLKALKSKSISQAFTEIEMSLIHLLLEANNTKQNVEISEINHVLGIKDKNIGLQKKVRSDVINAINDKYNFITQSEIALIGSVRKEDDKRFFEYFIHPTEVKTIQKLIEKN